VQRAEARRLGLLLQLVGGLRLLAALTKPVARCAAASAVHQGLRR
jgi:hypothetical protein